MGIGNDVVHLTNGMNTVEVSDFETALELLPPGSDVVVEATGTVGNTTVHNLSRLIGESNVLVSLDLSTVTELSRVYDSPFQGNRQLLSIHFPCNLLSINPRAFSDCTALSSVIIPATVEKIGAEAFSGCTALHHLEFKEPNGWYYEDDAKGKVAVSDFAHPAENPEKFTHPQSAYCAVVLRR